MSDEQAERKRHMAELGKRSNRTRSARAKLKQQIHSRHRNPIRVLQDPPAYAEGMKIEEFLRSIKGMGRHKVQRLLTHCEIDPLTKLGTKNGPPNHGRLTNRQRVHLARGLKEKMWLR